MRGEIPRERLKERKIDSTDFELAPFDVEVPSRRKIDARRNVHREELLEEQLASVWEAQVREFVRPLQRLAHLATARTTDQSARATNGRCERIGAHQEALDEQKRGAMSDEAITLHLPNAQATVTCATLRRLSRQHNVRTA